MNSQVLNIILNVASIIISLVFFILIIVTYKKTDRKPLFAIIGTAVMLAFSVVAMLIPNFPFYVVGFVIFVICLIVQASIVLANEKNAEKKSTDNELDFTEFDKDIFETPG